MGSKIHPAIKYADDILEGRIPSGKWTQMACERYFDDMEELKHKEWIFDPAEPKAVIEFFSSCLKNWKGKWAGTPIELQPNQQFLIWNQFGFKLAATKKRRFRRTYKSVARKNGKTTEAAGKGLFHLTLDEEPGAQVHIGASKEEQARIALTDMKGFIKYSDTLPRYLDIFAKTIYNPENMGIVAPLGRDSKTQDGLHTSWGLIDEFHAHPDSGIIDVIEGGMKGRAQPMLDIITTRGFNLTGPCYAFEGLVEDVLQGIKHDDSLLCIIYAMDEEDDWRDPDNWIKANPNLGVTTFKEDIRVTAAINEGGEKEVEVLTKDLNKWVGSASTWIGDHIVKENQDKPIVLQGQKCWAGLDLASSQDTNSLALLIPNGEKFDIKVYTWMPEAAAHARKDKATFNDWNRSDFLTLTKGDIMDHRFIIKEISDIASQVNLQMIGYDRRYASSGVIQELFNEQELPMKEVPQSYASLHAATVEFKDWMLKRLCNLEHNPVIRWMLGNVFITFNSDDLQKVDRRESKDKIDGAVAIVMAVKAYLEQEEKIDPNNFQVW